MTMPVALPFGLRKVKIRGYTTPAAIALKAQGIQLPNSRTFSFTETEEFETLRGDDSDVATHGAGPQVQWELEAGGYSMEAVAEIYGGTITETGAPGSRTKKLRKKKSDQRPYFLVEGQIISDSGGDLHAVVWRCKATGDLTGEFADGQFWLTGASGIGLPCLIPGLDVDTCWDFVQNEQITDIV